MKQHEIYITPIGMNVPYKVVEFGKKFAFVSEDSLNRENLAKLSNGHTWSNWHDSLQALLNYTFNHPSKVSFSSSEEAERYNKPILKLSMQEIAEKFNYPVDKIKIV